MNYTTTTNGITTSSGTVYYNTPNGVVTAQMVPQNNPQQITVTIQPDTDWVSHNIVPLGWFMIELAIALAIVAGARCALAHFVGDKPLIPTKRK